jgi:hypothetical protein
LPQLFKDRGLQTGEQPGCKDRRSVAAGRGAEGEADELVLIGFLDQAGGELAELLVALRGRGLGFGLLLLLFSAFIFVSHGDSLTPMRWLWKCKLPSQ